MKVRPLHDRLVVRRIEETEHRIGGIIIPDSAKEKPQQGTVIAAGHGRMTDTGKRLSLDLKAGDRILFSKFSGQEVTLDGEAYLIMKADDVLAVLDDPVTHRGTVTTSGTKKKKKKTTTTKTRPRKSTAVVSKGTSRKKTPRTSNQKR